MSTLFVFPPFLLSLSLYQPRGRLFLLFQHSGWVGMKNVGLHIGQKDMPGIMLGQDLARASDCCSCSCCCRAMGSIMDAWGCEAVKAGLMPAVAVAAVAVLTGIVVTAALPAVIGTAGIKAVELVVVVGSGNGCGSCWRVLARNGDGDDVDADAGTDDTDDTADDDGTADDDDTAANAAAAAAAAAVTGSTKDIGCCICCCRSSFCISSVCVENGLNCMGLNNDDCGSCCCSCCCCCCCKAIRCC